MPRASLKTVLKNAGSDREVTGKWVFPSQGAPSGWCRNLIGSDRKQVDTVTSNKTQEET